MKKLFTIAFVIIFSTPLLLGQSRKISGIITASEDNSPLVGVSILDKATGNYSVSSADGSYSIEVNSKSQVLTYISMGYRDVEVEIGSKSVINVLMEIDAMSLDATMVVAYGQGKKTSFTGSASVVKKEDIQKIPTSNITKSLQGLSTGVQVINSSGQPGDNASITIRGLGSMNASSSPLYVVDGIPFSGYLNSISSSDVESITILKDASATALYGSRAANGVIVITTKQGQNESGKISFKANISFPKLAVDMPRKLNPKEFTEVTWLALYQGYQDEGMSETEAANRASGNLINTMKTNPWNINTPVGLDGKLTSDAKLLAYGDWENELFASRPRQEYTIDFSGKKGNTNYFVSGSYLNDLGLFTTQQFERFSGRVNINTKVKEWIEIGSNTALSHSLTDAPATSDYIWFLRTVPSIYPIFQYDYDEQKYILDDNGNKVYDYGMDSRKMWMGWNPLADAKYNKYITKVDNLSTRNFIEITFFKDLKFRSNLSLDYFSSNYSGYSSAEHGSSADRGGAATKTNSRDVSLTWNNLLTYSKTITEHSFNVLIGHESYLRNANTLTGSKEGFPFGGLYELASAAEMTDLSSWSNNYRLLSFFGRAEYDYDNKYYISGSLRSDGSSRFSKTTRWGTFWSVGASWRISNENFLKSAKWIDNLKIKASYGAVGNDGLSTWYAYQGLYSTGYDDFGKAGVMISRLPNESLKWETNLQFNAGVEFTFWNRISGSIEYFDRKSKDLLFPMPKAPSTGIGSIDKNIGDVRNYGVELTISALAIDKPNFKWNIDFNATHYKNIITKLPQNEMSQGIYRWKEGESRYNFWGAEYAGINHENGNDMWWKNVYETSGDGEQIIKERVKTENSSEVTGNDQKKYLGNALPTLYGGLTNTFSFYGVDLSFMFYYSIGGYMYDSDYSQMVAFREGSSMHPDVLNSWTKDNKGSTITKFATSNAVSSQQFSSKYIFENSFLRLRNVTLGYSLPKRWLKAMRFSDLRVYVQGENLFTVGEAVKRGTDPEQSVSGTTGNRFPTTKSFSFGLQFTL